MRLLVDVETFEYSYFPQGSEGFNIALSDSRDRAIVRQQGAYFRSKCSDKSCVVSGFYIQPGTESMVAMQVVGYGTTQDAIGHFNPQERNCYNDDEFQPLYFNKV